jgi:hypothetical protein
MANETTASTLSAYIRTEVMAKEAIKAHLPRMVASGLCHQDSISGLGSAAKRYFKQGDLGAASAGTEGTALSSNTALSLGTSVTVTPTEGVATLAQITENGASLALSIPFEQVQRAFVDGSSDALCAMLEPIINELIPMGMQKMEADCLALLSSLGTSVGATTVNCSIADLIAAQYQLRINQPLRGVQEAKYLMAEKPINDVNVEALSTSGGVGGALWMQQANYGLANAKDDMGAGFLGTFLGAPVHVYDSELNVLANADTDVLSAFGVFGVKGKAPDECGGRPGAWVYLEKAPLTIRIAENLPLRGVDVVMTAHYLFAELVDKNAVKIISNI